MRASIALAAAGVLLSLGSVAEAQPRGIAGVLADEPAALTTASLVTGSRDPAVRELQERLVAMGFAIPPSVTGRFDAETTKSVRNFQGHARSKFADVTPTGKVDEATLRALAALPARGHVPSNVYDGKRCRVVVLKAEHRTFVFDDAGKVAAVFPNAVGNPPRLTGNGIRTIQGKLGKAEAQETGRRLWNDPNVFGDRIVNLNGPVELHGTNAPSSIGRDASHGCVRHWNPHIVQLADLVKVNDLVAIAEGIDDPRLGR